MTQRPEIYSISPISTNTFVGAHTLFPLILALNLLFFSIIFPSYSHASRTIRVSHEQNHPMAGTTDAGKSQGILIDLIEETARRENWKIQYTTCIWDKCLESLENNETDILVAIAYKPERAKRYSFNKHTVISNWGLLYTRPDRKIETYTDLNGKRIAVVKNDVYCNEFIRLIQQFNISCDLVFADNFKDIFSRISRGEVDAGVANRFFSLLNEGNFKVKPTQIIFSPVSIHIAAPLGKNADILAAFDRRLEDMKKDRNSVYYQSLKRWLGIEMAGHKLPALFWWISGGIAGLSLLMAIFVALLRREVRKKTGELRKLTKAVEQSANSVIITDTDGYIEYANPYFFAVTGYSSDEVIGKKPSILKSGDQPPELYENLWNTLKSGHEWRGELKNRKKDGTVFWEQCSIAPVRNEAGIITHFVGIKEDITVKKAQEDVLTWHASHDTLTGLHNRYYLESHLSSLIMKINRQHQHVSVLLVDIDNMKFVNDTFGHDFGDQLIKEISRRLKDAACPESLLARFFGDEFIICPPYSDSSSKACMLAQKIKDLMGTPFMVEGAEIMMGASIGVATFPEDGENVDNLLRNAEAAMYEAKKQGRNTIVCYSDEFNQRAQHRLMLDSRLHRALENQDFTLHYQPQINSADGSIKGVEALLRWNPVDMEPVTPAEFIPVLEETCLIVPVGIWVLYEACRQMKEWLEAGLPPFTISVNISAVQFQRGDLEDTLKMVLADTGLDPSLLRLELTESTLLIDSSHTINKLEDLRKLGISLSLDDFGTGYSSLAYLSRLPVQELKVDQSFVQRIHKTHTDTAVVNTIVAMAQELGLEVVAEGVETEEQRQHLIERGCETIQGFLYSRPLPAEELKKFVLSLKAPGIAVQSHNPSKRQEPS